MEEDWHCLGPSEPPEAAFLLLERLSLIFPPGQPASLRGGCLSMTWSFGRDTKQGLVWFCKQRGSSLYSRPQMKVSQASPAEEKLHHQKLCEK